MCQCDSATYCASKQDPTNAPMRVGYLPLIRVNTSIPLGQGMANGHHYHCQVDDDENDYNDEGDDA